MRWFGGKPKTPTTANIPIYYVHEVVDGGVRTLPIGYIHRTTIIEPDSNGVTAGTWQYLSVEIEGRTAILCKTAGGQVDAISFLSLVDATSFPGFVPFPDVDRKAFWRNSQVLNHFPRSVVD